MPEDSVYYPGISCVVIGLNCERTLKACLNSVKYATYPKKTEIIYVDSGSKDGSIDVAKGFGDIRIVELHDNFSTPGKGRNAGWRIAGGEWVQFLDSDTIMNRIWLQEAVKYITDDVGAIFGFRKEISPKKNWMHFIADLEWRSPGNKGMFFGGEVLIRRKVLDETGGYLEGGILCGEDPELAARIRKRGWKLKEVDILCSQHDIDMSTAGKYFRHALRNGYGFLSTGIEMWKNGERSWLFRTGKIILKVLLVLGLFTLGFILRSALILLAGLAIFLAPLLKIFYFKKNFRITFTESLVYALHCTIVIWPVFCGIIIYFFRKLFRIKWVDLFYR